MSSNSNVERPSLSRRSSARMRTVSGSESESSCSRNGSSSVIATTAHSDISESIIPEQLKRKKRRKNDFNCEKQENKLRKPVLDMDKCKKLKLEMIREAKLKVAVVQLIRIEDEQRLQQQQFPNTATQPKLNEVVEEEKKKEVERLRLPGLTLPAEIDPRILQQQLVVKINKSQTEQLLRSKRQQLQTVNNSECVNRLTEKLDVCSSDNSNKCTKNANVSNCSSGRKVARISVYKSNNKLPEKCLKDYSKCTPDSALPVETSISESQPESSKSCMHSGKRQKHSSFNQSSDKLSVILLEDRTKCPEELDKRHPEGSVKDTRRNSKNTVKNIEKQCEVYAAGKSKKDESEKQLDIPCEKNKKVLRNVVEGHPRFRRNLASRSTKRHLNDLIDNNQSEQSVAQNDKLSDIVDEIIQDSSKCQNDSFKKVTRNATDKHENHIANIVSTKTNDIKKCVEQHSKKNSKWLDKKIECSKNETDSKKVSKKIDHKNEKSSGNILESCINYLANSVDEPEKLPEKLIKDVKVCIKNSIDNVKYKQNSVIKTDKSTEHVLENDLDDTQTIIDKISINQSQNVDNLVQLSKNSNENNAMVQENAVVIAQVVNESNKEHSKSTDIKVSLLDTVKKKKPVKKNVNKKFSKKLVENSTNNHLQNKPAIVEEQNKNDSNLDKESKIVPETSLRPKRRLAGKNNEVDTEVLTENSLKSTQHSVDTLNERLITNLNKNITECNCNIETDKGRTRKLSEKKDDYTQILLENTIDNVQQSYENVNTTKIFKKSNNKVEETIKLQTETTRSVSIKSTLETSQNSVEDNQKVLPEESNKTIKNCSKISITNKIATRRSSVLTQEQNTDKLEENHRNVLEDFGLEMQVMISNGKEKIDLDSKNNTILPDFRRRGRPKKLLPVTIEDTAEVSAKDTSDCTPHDTIKKINSISKTSNKSKMITRKSSDNKHDKLLEKIVKSNLDNSEKIIEKNKEQLPEETQGTVRMCSKSQTENEKRVTRKSSPDKHERHNENLTKNISEGMQSVIENSDENISEKQRKIKDCSKIQTETLKRITRKTAPDNCEKYSDNLIVNSMDSAQNSIDDQDQILAERLDNKENSKSQIEINSRITKNAPSKRDRQSKNLGENNLDCVQTIMDEKRDKSSENLASNLKAFPNSRKLFKNSIDKTNETYTESLENDISIRNLIDENIDNHTKSPKDIVKENKKLKRNCISKHVQSFTEDNLPDCQYSLNSNDKKELSSACENTIDYTNVVVECVESERQSEETDNKTCSNGLINYALAESLAEEIINRAVSLIEHKELCTETIANVAVEKEPKMNDVVRVNESVIEDAEDNQSLAERYQKYLERDIPKHVKFINNDNKSKTVDQTAVRCSERIALRALRKKKKQSKENLPVELHQTNDESHEDSITESDNKSILISNKKLVTNVGMNTSTNLGGVINTVEAEDFDEVIKFFFIPANPNIKIINESLSSNLKLAEHPISDVLENQSQTSVKCVDRFLELSNETKASISNSNINVITKTNTSPLTNTQVLEANKARNILLENIEDALVDNVFNTSGQVVEGYPIQELTEVLSIPPVEINEKALSKQIHETALVELRKKCTENLERRHSASQETETPVTSVLPIEDSGDHESDKSSTSSSDSSEENGGTESEEGNYANSVDSDENLADRLAQLRNLEIPLLNSSDDTDSGVQTATEEHQQQKRIEKIVLRCPRRSFLEINATTGTKNLEISCNDCNESFVSNRELQKHVKVQHRQRLVMKIRKTEENKHAAHIVEQPVSKRLTKEEVDDEEDEGNASASPEKLDEDESGRVQEDDQIAEGEIKIIVRKENGATNTHVVKEIKITPKSNSDCSGSTRILNSSPARSDFGSGCSSSRIPGSSPARSDLGSSIGGGNSCRMPGNSPQRFEITPAVTTVRKRGRPRKYPIFTEAELIAKQLEAQTSPQVNNGATSNARKKKDDSPFIVEGIFGKRNEDVPLFEAVESIVIQPDFLFDTQQNIVVNESRTNNLTSNKSLITKETQNVEEPTIIKETEAIELSTMRKRRRTLSQDNQIPIESDVATIIQEKSVESSIVMKRRRTLSQDGLSLAETEAVAIDQKENTLKAVEVVTSETDEKEHEVEINSSQILERNSNQPDLCIKYHITKELVVQLTKIDSVPKEDGDESANDTIESEIKQIDTDDKKIDSTVPLEETPRRSNKPKIIVNELVQASDGSNADLRAVIRLNLRRKLESNNNVVAKDIDKCLVPTSSNNLSQITETDSSSATEESTIIQSQAVSQMINHQLQCDLQTNPELQPIQKLQVVLKTHGEPCPPLVPISTRPSTSKNSCGNSNCEFHIDDDFDTLEDNETTVSEQQLIVAPQPSIIKRAEPDESQKAKLFMLMNATTPFEPTNKIITPVTNIAPTCMSHPSLHQSQLKVQSHVQQQVQTQSQLQIQVQIEPQIQTQLPPLIQHQVQFHSQQIQSIQTPKKPQIQIPVQPQIQQLPQTQVQLPQIQHAPQTQVQLPHVQHPPQTQVQLPQIQHSPQTQVQLPAQTQLQLSSHGQMVHLQQAAQGIQAQLQLPPQAQLVQLQQSPQQFCILFFPDSDGTNSSKDGPPTATIVNFQPVPDNEIANKPLIYMPTTPTKISVDDHAKQYICATCTQVLDFIGRLEASLGMTEEDKSAIKCPYCSNHFQSLFYLEYHIMQEHLKCENEKQCRHAGFSSLRIPTHEVASEFEIYITFALKCRSCYDIFNTVLQLNDHVMHKHKTLVRLKPTSLPFPSVTSPGPAFLGSPFARKNGDRTHVAVLQCPSDCVCRIGIRSTDSPLQRQQMLKRCPNAMRRLEKIEPAAYEVYTCTLCKSTFLMKDEVVDHLMKMHEVSCKFPCYTCLTSFRSLQMQENHRCSETTLHDLDKLLSIAILPVNVSGSGKNDRGKYLEREDSSTDEYGTIKAAAATASNNLSPSVPTTPVSQNGYKRKNGETVAALQSFLTANAAKRAKQQLALQKVTFKKGPHKRKKMCPQCKTRFAYGINLRHHIVYEHLLKDDISDKQNATLIELFKIITTARPGYEKPISEALKGLIDDDSVMLKNYIVQKYELQKLTEMNKKNGLTNGEDVVQCSKCKRKIIQHADSSNQVEQSKHQQFNETSANLIICNACKNSGPTSQYSTVINNGSRTIDNSAIHLQASSLPITDSYTCKKCPETFPSPMELKFHKRSIHKIPDKQFICDICKKTFASSRMLEKHKKIHREAVLDESLKSTTEDDNTSSSHTVSECNKDSNEANDSLNDKSNSSNRRDSSDSSSGTSKEPEEQPLNCSFCEEVCSSKVSLKNHLKREHGRRASICQFCNGLLIDTSEVRHMLDYHIIPSKSTSRSILAKSNGTILHCEASCMQDDVEELVRTLGKHRLQSLMMYHDFEGKCNNAIMRCPMCPELFATRESCRFHYVWIHDNTCLLCDETFRSGSSAFQHKVDAHTSTASYLWCIQRLVTAIVYTLRLDPDQPSHVLYQMLAMRIEDEEAAAIQAEQVTVRGTTGSTEKTSTEESTGATDRFGLEAVVLSEDQLPDSSNMIEVVIGKEDSEDDLLSMLNLSPNYESCSEQHRMPNAGVAPPEEEEDEETAATAMIATMAVSSVPTTPILSSAVASAVTTPTGVTSTTGSPVLENYVTSGVCKYRLENDEEQLVLVVTDEDLITFRDDIGSLAERISTTCDSLTLDEITEMLKAYFDSVNGVTSNSAGA